MASTRPPGCEGQAGGSEPGVRVAVIGCGAISDEHLRFLCDAPYVEIASVCDVSPALAEIARDRFGARRADTDVESMLAEVRPDVVHVLTPPRFHSELIRRSLAVGAHVVCEKPLAPTADETRALLRVAADADRVLVETRNLLYNDIVLALDRAISAGSVGEIREVDVSLALDLGSTDVGSGPVGLPAGVAHDYLPHLAYLMLHLAPELSDADDIVGTIGNLSGHEAIGADHVDAHISGAHVRARLRISPDVLPHSMRVAVRGTGGSLEADLYQPYLRREGPPWTGNRSPFGMMFEGARLAAAGGRNVRDRLLQHTTYHGMPRMLADVYDAIRTECAAPVAEQDMIASAVLIDRIVGLGGRRT